jgi:hypothetical protein
MPTPTYQPLATVTLGSSAASVTFSSIPATYRDLILVLAPTSTVQTEVFLELNGDTNNASYPRVRATGSGSSTFSGAENNRKITFFADVIPTTPSTHIVQFLDANATDKHKTYLTRSSRAGAGVDMLAHRFTSTSVISSMKLVTESGSFATGSMFSLYGIVA